MNKIENYLNHVCTRIHYKKLRNKIRNELKDHINDTLEEVAGDYENRDLAIEAVLSNMGDAYELGNELKYANRKILFMARLMKIFIAILILVAIYCIFLCFLWINTELTTYNHATDIKTMERIIADDCNDGKPIKLVAEIENNGYLWKYYMPVEETKNSMSVFTTSSTKVFGFSIYDKFGGYSGCSVDKGGDCTFFEVILYDRPFAYQYRTDSLWILTGETEEKYIKRYYEPIDPESGLEAYWSDFKPIPQNGTYDNPVVVLDNTPDGYTWSNYEKFDENKEPIY